MLRQKNKTKKPWIIGLIITIFLFAALGSGMLVRDNGTTDSDASASASYPADINSDGVVNISDVSLLVSKWGSADVAADVNHDGVVSIADLSLVISMWGSTGSASSMPVGDLTGWKQIFTDDFTTAAPLGSFLSIYGTKWGAYPSIWHDTSGNGIYSPEKTLSVANGVLDMYIHSENGIHYVSAPQPKLFGAASPAGTGQTYGRYSVRFRSDAIAGYKTAWLLWPDSEAWPDDGEIDFPEGNLNSTISAYAHYASTSGGQDTFEGSTARYTDWHIATTEWSAGKITFILDGTVIGTSTTKVPSKPMHWVLQTETALDGTVPSNTAAGHLQIDWVAAWAKQ